MRFPRTLGWLVCATPLVLAWALLGPGMISRADGCSGGPSVMLPGWNLFNLQSDPAMPSNGVLVWRGGLKDLPLDAALAAVSVEVVDAAKAPVAGTLRIEDLGSPSDWYFLDGREAAVVFTPAAPLVPGATYHVEWTLDPTKVAAGTSPSGKADFTVASGPVASAAPTASVSFRRDRRLVGETVSCTYPGFSSCDPEQVSFGDTEVQRPVLALAVSFPPVNGSTYQVTRFRAVPGKGTVEGDTPVIEHLPPYADYVSDPHVTFLDDLPEYCVEMVTEDLTTGAEVTQTLCAARTDAEAAGESLLEQAVAGCTKPPTPALAGLWCKSHPAAAECGASGPGGGSGSSGSCATDPDAAGCSDAGEGGCTLAPTKRRFGLGGLAAVLAGLAAARRRGGAMRDPARRRLR